ncbi:hypothetical protein [Micromonospora sp. NPDC049645]|uniref:hypothetical protein n=1 Tax=Micromonospora sp. NPDC049645 TaxID=3155508 RepID=UPI00343765D6
MIDRLRAGAGGLAGRANPDGPLVTGEWQVTGETVGDHREQYVGRDVLAAQPGSAGDGEGREVLDATEALRAAAGRR